MNLRQPFLCALVLLSVAIPGAADAPRWAPIGPSAVASGNTRFSGPVRALAVDPGDLRTVFAGTDMGGLWRTRDGGLTWKAVADEECSLSIPAVAVDPGDPSIVYAGTGRSPFLSPGEDACGILRSTDGGETWTRLPASVFPVPFSGTAAAIHDLLVDPRALGRPETTMLLAATSVGLFFSSDGGGSFSRVLGSADSREHIWDLVRDPSNPDVVYAAGEAGAPFTANQNAVFKSVDAGQTWQPASQGLPISGTGPVKLAIAASSPGTLYALIGGLYLEARLFRSSDGAATWTEVVPVGTELVCQCAEGGAIAVSPTNPEQVYFGGDTFQVSTDGGRHWSTFSGGHRGYRTLVFDSRTRLYAGNSSGLFWTGDHGRSWQGLNAGLEITELASVTPHPANPSLVYAGALGHGIIRTTGSREWHRFLEGAGGGKVLFSPDRQSVYVSFHKTGFHRSDDGGQSFAPKIGGLPGGGYSAFPAPVAFSGDDPDRLFLGGQELFRSDNRGDSWYSMGNLLAASEVYTALGTGAALHEEVIYAGTSLGKVWRTDTGGFTWVDSSSGLPAKHLTDLEVDPDDSRIVYATFSSFGTGGVYKTTDGGLSWNSLSRLPAMDVNRLLLLRTSPRTLVIAADPGVYVSYDDGQSWTEDRSGLPGSPVVDVAIAPDGRLLAATFGRGVYAAPGLPAPAPAALRLGRDDRFEVKVAWKTPAGLEGEGQQVRLTSDTGVFWFFQEENLELVVKVLDGCGLNERYWFFAGGLTDIEVTITVRDLETGATRTYHHAGGSAFEPIQDTSAFAGCVSPASALAQPAAAAPAAFCDGTALCLGEGGRFRVEAAWTTSSGEAGVAQGVGLTSDTGYLFFFDPANVEVLVKTVDGCGVNGRHWIFAGGLTDVEMVLKVTDTATQQVREYRNPKGQAFRPIQDTGAFASCP
jgi:photosystem II stability/assembly factor-like uncharacterized protein